MEIFHGLKFKSFIENAIKEQKKLEAILVNETNTRSTSMNPCQLPLAFTLIFYLKRNTLLRCYY
jgi:hypothetical protein